MTRHAGPRHAGPRLAGAHLAVLVAAAAVALLAGCAASEAPVTTFPPASVGPERTVSPAVGLTRVALETGLRDRGLALVDVQVPFRPAEGAHLADIPRAVYQVVLPADPDGGYLVVYEFPDGDRANQAAQSQATYLGSGPGRVQSSLEAEDIIRVVGATMILYTWIPGEAPDPQAPAIKAVLETLGYGVEVPS